jgi:hypothetical protein
VSAVVHRPHLPGLPRCRWWAVGHEVRATRAELTRGTGVMRRSTPPLPDLQAVGRARTSAPGLVGSGQAGGPAHGTAEAGHYVRISRELHVCGSRHVPNRPFDSCGWGGQSCYKSTYTMDAGTDLRAHGQRPDRHRARASRLGPSDALRASLSGAHLGPGRCSTPTASLATTTGPDRRPGRQPDVTQPGANPEVWKR